MTPETRRRRSGPLPIPEKRRLLRVQRRIDAGRQAAEERAVLFAELYDAGYTYTAIADALGLTHEMVRKSILSRSETGYPHPR